MLGEQHAAEPKPIQESPAVGATGEGDPEVVTIGEQRQLKTKVPEDRLAPSVRNSITWAFLSTLVVGLLAEIALDAKLGTGAACAAMITYFLYGLSQAKEIRNTERFADSLYYLGFILTLAALFLAMVPAFQLSGNITSQGIIEKFGIGIATTFIGMTLRIILIQMRPTVSDQEEEARESISRYILQLNNEMRGTIDAIRDFRERAIVETGSTANIFQEQLRQIGTDSESAVTESNTAIARTVREITARMDASMQEVVGRLRNLDVPTDIISERLDASAKTLTADIENLRKILNTSTASFAGALAGSVEAITRIKTDIDGLQVGIALANQSVGQSAKMSAQTVEGARQFAEGASEAANSMQLFRDRAAALAQMLTELNSRLDARAEVYQQGIQSAADEIKKITTEVRGDAGALTRSLVEGAQSLRDAVRDARRIS